MAQGSAKANSVYLWQLQCLNVSFYTSTPHSVVMSHQGTPAFLDHGSCKRQTQAPAMGSGYRCFPADPSLCFSDCGATVNSRCKLKCSACGMWRGLRAPELHLCPLLKSLLDGASQFCCTYNAEYISPPCQTLTLTSTHA